MMWFDDGSAHEPMLKPTMLVLIPKNGFPHSAYALKDTHPEILEDPWSYYAVIFLS